VVVVSLASFEGLVELLFLLRALWGESEILEYCEIVKVPGLVEEFERGSKTGETECPGFMSWWLCLDL
jgi:hypothetical protein